MDIDFNYQAYQSAQIKIPGVASPGQTGQKWFFPDLPYLRPNRARIKCIEVYTVNSITYSPISNTAIVTEAILEQSSLTLYGGVPGVKQGNEIIQNLPLVRLNNIQNDQTDPFVRVPFLLHSMQVDWTKSFVSISTAPANTTDMVFAFGIYFDFIPDSEQQRGEINLQ